MRVAIPRGCVLWTSGLQTHCADIKWRTSRAQFGHRHVRSWPIVICRGCAKVADIGAKWT